MLIITYLFIVLLFICWSDLYRRSIPNSLVLAVLAGTLIANAMTSTYSGWLSALVVLGITGVLVGVNVLGAGDSKLATALALVLPISSLPLALWLTAITGGIIACLYLLKYRLLQRKSTGKDPGLPYGIAIAVGFYFPILVHLL
ncbi:A24 family peptidase [Photobacterium nomapromontoriensis]|uniref:A24 family peptidase n=1 Tax=Photobacterium nomapromontoriensis TaxID=2910237 RepID=UPI003D10D4BD